MKTHAVRVPRIGYVHSWLGTQDEGWWREALDALKIPYEYISTQVVAATPNLNAKYDVILFPPVGRRRRAGRRRACRCGATRCRGRRRALTPNIGKIDSTDDMRPGLGFTGLANLDAFVRSGGLLITTDDTADLAVNYGLTQGVAIQRSQKLNVPGSVVRSKFVDLASPMAYGYDENLSVYLSGGLIFSVSNTLGGRGPRFGGRGRSSHRPRHGRRSRRAAGAAVRGAAGGAEGGALAGRAGHRRAAAERDQRDPGDSSGRG